METLPKHSEGEIVRRGVVAVLVRGDELLVIRRAQSVVAAGFYCFPGGGIEENESEPEAMVREIQEELGARARPIRRLGDCVTSWRVSLAWWLAEIDATTPLKPNPEEVESIHWHTPEQMARLPNLLESNTVFLERLGRGEIDLSVKGDP